MDFLFSPLTEFEVFNICIVVFLGLVLGSLSSAITYREPRNISWIGLSDKNDDDSHGGSFCPQCNTELTARDLIPVVSWVLSKGRCRHCGKTVSPLYPLSEVLTVLGCLGIYHAYGLSWSTMPAIAMIPFLVSLIMIDFKYMILPNRLVGILFGLGCLALGVEVIKQPEHAENILLDAIGASVFFGVFSWGLAVVMKKILKKDALGFGDVKFFIVAGLWLGSAVLPVFLIISGVGGVVLALLWKRLTGNEIFPFGPSLIISFYAIYVLQGYHVF